MATTLTRLNLSGLSNNNQQQQQQQMFSVPLSARGNNNNNQNNTTTYSTTSASALHSARSPYVQSKALRPSSTTNTARSASSSVFAQQAPQARGHHQQPQLLHQQQPQLFQRAPRGTSSVVSFAQQSSSITHGATNSVLSPQRRATTSATAAGSAASIVTVEELNSIDSVTVGDHHGSLRLVDAVLIEGQSNTGTNIHRNTAAVAAAAAGTARSGSTASTLQLADDNIDEHTARSNSPSAAAPPALRPGGSATATTTTAAAVTTSAAAVGMTRSEICTLKPAAIVTFSVSNSGGLAVQVISRFVAQPVTLVVFSVAEIRKLDFHQAPSNSSSSSSSSVVLVVGSDTGSSITLRASSPQANNKLAFLFKLLYCRCRGVLPARTLLAAASSSADQQQHQQVERGASVPPVSARSNFTDNDINPRSGSPPSATAPLLAAVANAAASVQRERQQQQPLQQSQQSQQTAARTSEASTANTRASPLPFSTPIVVAPIPVLPSRANRKELLLQELSKNGIHAENGTTVKIGTSATTTARRRSLPTVIVEEGHDPRPRSRSATPVES